MAALRSTRRTHSLPPLLRGGRMEIGSLQTRSAGAVLLGSGPWALGPDAKAAPREHHNHRPPYGNAVSRSSWPAAHHSASSHMPIVQRGSNCPQLPNEDPPAQRGCTAQVRSTTPFKRRTRRCQCAPAMVAPPLARHLGRRGGVGSLPPPPAPRRPFHRAFFFAPALLRASFASQQ